MPRPAKVACGSPVCGRIPRLWSWCATGLLCGTMLFMAGCSRSFWRQNADDNTYAILRDKSADPRWEPPRLDLQPDVRSRFFDPYDPDCEPLPPDDPTAHAYMHWMGRNTGMAKVDQPWTGGVLHPWFYPQKPIRGWKSWHQFGDALTVENPQWLEPFGLTPEQMEEQRNSGMPEGPGIAGLTLPQAVELSYIHSRDFQLQLENLYSTALDLTFERFRFDLRYLGVGGRKPGMNLSATERTGSTTMQASPHLGVSKLLPAGGQFIVEMANNTLWLFSGGNQSSTATTLSYSLVQPLLLGAGRQVVLESLTQSERDSLYAMRAFARFRQVFFVRTVTTYYQLLQQYQGLLNQRYNIKLLRQQSVRSLAVAKEPLNELKVILGPLPENFQLPALPPKYAERLRFEPVLRDLRWTGGRMTAEELAELQKLIPVPAIQAALGDLYALSAAGDTLSLTAAQLVSQLATQEIQLLSSEQQLQDSLDAYKFQLGLPPDLWLTMNVDLLRPFQLISPTLQQLEEEATLMVDRMAGLPEDQLVSPELQAITNEMLVMNQKIIDQGLKLIEQDFEAMQNNREHRLATMPTGFDSEFITRAYERDGRLIGIARQELDLLSKRLTSLKEVLATRAANQPKDKAADKPKDPKAPANDKEKEPPVERVDPVDELSDIRERMVKVVQNMEVVQINMRVELINLNSFEMAIDEVVQTGLENRVDLMNERAKVMDARRKMEVFANTLRSQLDITAAGDIATVPLAAGNTTPFEFRKDQSNFRFGVAFTAPMDQVAQRNNYRQSLIVYQQARRAYMQAEDQVKLDIRNEWRVLNTLKRQFEINRRNMRTTAMQYDNAVEQMLAPAMGNVGGGGGGGASNQQTGVNLLNALNAVLNAQNGLIRIWVNYEVNRLNIYRDMGIMQLDENGVWIEDYYQRQFNPQAVTNPAEQGTEGVKVPDIPLTSPAPAPLIPPRKSP